MGRVIGIAVFWTLAKNKDRFDKGEPFQRGNHYLKVKSYSISYLKQ